MNADEIIKELRRYGLSSGTTLGRHMGIMDIAADKIEELNDFQNNQCAKMIADLTTAHAKIAELEAERAAQDIFIDFVEVEE